MSEASETSKLIEDFERDLFLSILDRAKEPPAALFYHLRLCADYKERVRGHALAFSPPYVFKQVQSEIAQFRKRLELLNTLK